jgi:hypothetical protein
MDDQQNPVMAMLSLHAREEQKIGTGRIDIDENG